MCIPKYIYAYVHHLMNPAKSDPIYTTAKVP